MRTFLANPERAYLESMHLWDYLSKAFIEQVRRFGEVHIFVRNFDRKSTHSARSFL